MASSEVPPPADASWDEDRCKAGLAQLERLQAQLDYLRLTIPRVVEPFSSRVTNGPVLYQAFKNATIGSQNDIKAFRSQWQDQEIQSILEHAQESLKKDSDLSAGAQVPRYGWREIVLKEKEASRRRKDGMHKSRDSETGLSEDEIKRIVEEFRTAHTNIRVSTKDDNRVIQIHFLAAHLNLKFRIVIQQEANGDQHKLDAECLGTVNPFLSITRSIATRPRANDLRYLLEMIAAYKTVKGSSCAKCSKMLDNQALIPTARRSKQISGSSEPSNATWEAFHENCLQ